MDERGERAAFSFLGFEYYYSFRGFPSFSDGRQELLDLRKKEAKAQLRKNA